MQHLLPDEVPEDETNAKLGSEEEDQLIEAKDQTDSTHKSLSAPVSPKKTPMKRYKIIKLDDDPEKKAAPVTKQITLFEMF
jgi:hypothetical protein